MPTLDQVVHSVRDAILARFHATRAASSRTTVAFEFGTPIPVKSFEVPDAPGTYSSVLATEFLSRHANVVPNLQNALFERSLRTVDGQYELLLRGSRPIDESEFDFFGAIKARAIREFEDELGATVGPYRYRPVYGSPVSWYEPQATENWFRHTFDARDNPAPAPAAERLDTRLYQWRVPSADLSGVVQEPFSERATEATARAIVRLTPQNPEFDQPEWAGELNQERAGRMRLFRRTRQPRERIDLVHVLRANRFAAQNVRDAALAVDRPVGVGGALHRGRHLDRVIEEAQPAPPERRFLDPRLTVGDAAERSWVVERIIAAESENKPVVTDQVSVSFEMCLLTLDRPWLSDGFLEMRNWYVPRYAQGSFSDGTPAFDEGALSVIPIACVLTRDVRIQASWTPEDSAVIESSANIGPFSLLGRSFDHASGTLTVPGVQSVAWVCEATPQLPPHSDPTQS